jgi:hypothetical protein
MDIKLSEYVSVAERADELGLQVPGSLAILPRNFDTADTPEALYHESSTLDLRRLLRQAGIIETPIEPPGVKIPTISEKYYEFIGPLLFFGASSWIGNESPIEMSMSVIGNYLTDVFKRTTGQKKARLGFVLERTKSRTCVRLDYEGRGDDFGQLVALIKEIMNEQGEP